MKTSFLNLPHNKVKNFGRKLAQTATVLTFLTLAPNLASAQHANHNNTKSSLGDIIENATGKILVSDGETGNGIGNAQVRLAALYVPPGDSIPGDYFYTTPSNGLINPYEILSFAALGVGIPENLQEQILNTPLKIFDINGKLVTTATATGLENTNLSYQVDLPSLANAMYIIQAEINGKTYNDKFISINNSYIGKLSLTNSSNNSDSYNNNSNKSSSTTLEDAIYEMTVTADGYQDYQATLSVTSGDNGWEYVVLDPNEGLPQNQDLTGRVYQMDDNNNITIAANANVYVTIDGQTTLIPTNSNGDWVKENVPCNKTAEVAFEIDENYYAIEDVYYTTPVYDENTWTASDTIHGNLNALLPTKREGTTALHIGQHANRGTILDDIKFYLGDSYNETRKQNIRDHIENMNSQVNNLYTFVESTTQLGNDGINFEDNGVNTTTPNTNASQTQWNHTLSYTSGANTSLSSTSSFFVTIHELLRGLGHNGVGWNSIMTTPVVEYTDEDRTIQDVAGYYYNAAHHGDQIHAIHINKLVEQIDSKKKESAVLQEIELDNVIYHFTN